jgi:hypothetical protein
MRSGHWRGTSALNPDGVAAEEIDGAIHRRSPAGDEMNSPHGDGAAAATVATDPNTGASGSRSRFATNRR